MAFKYWLFERSAVERMANLSQLQSEEYQMGNDFVSSLLEEHDVSIDGIAIHKADDGIIFCGEKCNNTFLLIDLEKSKINSQIAREDLLTVVQKLFRFSIRYWNQLGFPQSEKVLNESNKAVVFPFSYSQRSNYRIVLERSPQDARMDKRDISLCLLAYKYSAEGTPKREEHPQTDIYRKGGQEYLEKRAYFINLFHGISKSETELRNEGAIRVIATENFKEKNDFKFLPFEKQIEKLSRSQKAIVDYDDLTMPIKIQGPAGTGKTASLVLRALKILYEKKAEGKDWTMVFFTHSKSTEMQVVSLFTSIGEHYWLDENSEQHIIITTLQEYCAKYIHFSSNEILDNDATEAKSLQLFLIQEAYKKVFAEIFDTYKYYMSDPCRTLFETTKEPNIVSMLQHEFSVRIKGMASGLLDVYQKTKPIENGIPAVTEDDVGFVFRIFKLYQDMLELQNAYDTDDVVIETIARLNAPLWRRQRSSQGFDYIIIDEMHLFNINEQNVFHYLTKDVDQKTIPICFALDYSQAIGDRGYSKDTYPAIFSQEYGLVFRNSRQIAELCASITASGATLFNAFINPYKYWQTSFTAKEEEKCDIPILYMFENDQNMLQGILIEVQNSMTAYQIQENEIAVVFFSEDLLIAGMKILQEKYNCNYINARYNVRKEQGKREITITYPEYLNGLEYSVVILVGVDEGRVPDKSSNDINMNFIKFSALNKLYLACSRAKYRVTIMGTNERGISSCLSYSIEHGTLSVKQSRSCF